jgi:UDPglucose--hexose-1-phosphate uridylyltransferase
VSVGNKWEQRWHPLREEWIIIAAHRQDRPWHGHTIAGASSSGSTATPQYDERCYFCPGNLRVGGARNDNYSGIFVFDNDHPCVGPNAPVVLDPAPGIYNNRPATGLARVVCYSPKHNLTLAELEISEFENLVTTWRAQYTELSNRPDVKHVLVFENKGEVVGVSNPHPHCQIYATNFIFKFIETEAEASLKYYRQTGRALLQDIIETEQKDGRRIIYENSSAIAFMPYFARYAYECYVAPKATHGHLADLSKEEIRDLARAMKVMLVRYDNLWRMPFPYVMTLHHAPLDGAVYDGFHFHIEFHPPLRKPNLLKYLAGPEIGGGNFLSDTLPEEKAEELRNLPDVHYKLSGGNA